MHKVNQYIVLFLLISIFNIQISWAFTKEPSSEGEIVFKTDDELDRIFKRGAKSEPLGGGGLRSYIMKYLTPAAASGLSDSWSAADSNTPMDQIYNDPDFREYEESLEDFRDAKRAQKEIDKGNYKGAAQIIVNNPSLSLRAGDYTITGYQASHYLEALNVNKINFPTQSPANLPEAVATVDWSSITLDHHLQSFGSNKSGVMLVNLAELGEAPWAGGSSNKTSTVGPGLLAKNERILHTVGSFRTSKLAQVSNKEGIVYGISLKELNVNYWSEVTPEVIGQAIYVKAGLQAGLNKQQALDMANRAKPIPHVDDGKGFRPMTQQDLNNRQILLTNITVQGEYLGAIPGETFNQIQQSVQQGKSGASIAAALPLATGEIPALVPLAMATATSALIAFHLQNVQSNMIPPTGIAPPPPALPPTTDAGDKGKVSPPPTSGTKVDTGNPPHSTGQVPPPPPLVSPIQEQSARDFVLNASMSKELEANMIRDGLGQRPDGHATHHIVAHSKNNDAAAASRKILEEFGIHINASANGVYLPDREEISRITSAMYHRSLHTKVYFQEVYNRLSLATDAEECLEILKDVREELLKGTFPK